MLEGQKLVVMVVLLCKVVVGLVANMNPCLQCHFLASDKEANWLKWEQLAPSLWFSLTIAEALLSKVITNTVELRASAQLFERHHVVLMCLHVGVVYTECQIPAIHKYIF